MKAADYLSYSIMWGCITVGVMNLVEEQNLYHHQDWARGDTIGIMAVLWFIVAAILSLRNKA